MQSTGTPEARFRPVFSHLGAIRAYARRRGSLDADALAAEVMTIAWRRLADVPEDDPGPGSTPRPGTSCSRSRARSRRSAGTGTSSRPGARTSRFRARPSARRRLNELSPLDREALLLTAWEELTPTEAARALGIKPTAFRVRLLRARRRVEAKLAEIATAPDTKLTMERT